MNLSRRDVLNLGAGATALWAVGVNVLARQQKDQEKGPRKKIPIGLQLYSLRDDSAKDLPGVLKAVAKMGYQGVEFAGYYERKADELRKMLDDNGLKCCGTHTGFNTIKGDALKGTIEFNKTIGNKYLIVPSLPGRNLASVEAIKDTAKLFTDLAAKGKEVGMRVGYHAHGGDFKKLGGETVWDIFFSNAGPDVVMQMDIGNCLEGGGDPLATLKKFPGRSATIHIKEYGGKPDAVIGEGEVKWAELFRICETTGGTEWYIVEQERYGGGSPLDTVKRCIENLRKMGK